MSTSSLRSTVRKSASTVSGGLRPDIPVCMLKRTAQRAARAAGEMLMRRFEGERTAHRLDSHDVKLDVDRLAEKIVLSEIRKTFPDHSLLSEESGRREGGECYQWIVDPLDGTVNYFYRIPYFCVSVACYHRCRTALSTDLAALGMPLVGVVFAPATGDMFVGAAGQGATRNGVPIRPGRESSLTDAVIAMSFGSDDRVMQRMETLGRALVRSARKVRIFGSTGLDLVSVASGRTSGLVQGAVRSWDFAAARVVLEQAGGRFGARRVGEDQWEIVAAAPGVFLELEALVRETS